MIRLIAVFFLMTGWMTAQGQRQMEVPGDNFSLEGALELFKKSSTPEEFERLLNHPDSKVNNLDLNGDGYIDYIRVIDMFEGNVHAFIMQAVISDNESQDIAVITLEKLANGKAVLQITGDEDIYGVETIIEPTREVRTFAGTQSSRAVVNVWAWPSVQYIYGPYYSTWVSPWGWRYRPMWWSPWRPMAYYDYYPYWSTYRPYYSVCYTHRVYAHHFYRPHRTTSVTVYHRHNTYITNYRTTRIENSNRAQNDGYRSNVRQNNASVRYDSNGRIIASGNQRTSAASSATPRNQTRSSSAYESSSGRQTNSSGNRSASEMRNGSSSESSNSSRQRSTMSNEKSGKSTPSVGNSRSNGNASGNSQRSTASPNVQERSSGNSNVQKSTGSSNARKSSGNSGVQPSERRKSAPANSNRSGSSASPNVQRSSGSANVQRSSPAPKSNVQRSSGNAGVQKSTGSSNARQSSGSSSAQQSSGRSSGGRQ